MGGLQRVKPGQPVCVHVPSGALHLFDPGSGRRLN